MVWGVEPSEKLQDPQLEERAREISQNIRCLVCQNESIDESNADLAGDMRILIREKIVEGLSDKEIYEFIVQRYGEFALFKPSMTINNLFLYLSGPILLILFFWVAFKQVKTRRGNQSEFANNLHDYEREELQKIVNKKTH